MRLIIIFVGLLAASALGLLAMWVLGDAVVTSSWVNQAFLLLVWGSLLLAAAYEVCVWVIGCCRAARLKCCCKKWRHTEGKRPTGDHAEAAKILVC